MRRADGAVVYLNGREVFRSNMPAGWVSYITLATTAVSLADANSLVETQINASALVPGLNHIAVEVHKNNGLSAVKSFDLSLTADGTAAPPPPPATVVVTRGPYLQMGTPNSVIVRWRTAVPTDSRVNYGESPTRLSFSATELTLTTEHILRLSNLAPNTKYYYSIGTSSQAALAGGDESHFFVTAPTVAKPTRIWVLGDAGTNTDDQRRVRDAYAKFTGTRHTDLWLLLGDNAYVEGKDDEYQRAVFEMYPTFLRQSVLWPTIGNHDTAGSISPPDDLPYYRSQEKEFHHEEHEEHEEEKRNTIFSGFCPSSFLRVLRALRGFIFLNPIAMADEEIFVRELNAISAFRWHTPKVQADISNGTP
jgi:hypothetical protein